MANTKPKKPIKELPNVYGTSLDVKHGTRGWFSQNAKSHSTATCPWTVHLAVPTRGHDLWQVDDGALSLDAYLLPPDGPPRHGEEDASTSAPDERGHDFWSVHSHAHGGSQAGVVGQPRKSQEATLAPATDAKGYKKRTPLNPRDRPHHVAPTV